MKLIGTNDIDVLLEGEGREGFYCQDHIYSIGTLHEYLEADAGEFRIPQLDIEFDTTKNFYNYFTQHIRPFTEYAKVRLEIKYNGNVIFNGYTSDFYQLETPNNTFKLTFDGGLSRTADYTFPEYTNKDMEGKRPPTGGPIYVPRYNISPLVGLPFGGILEKVNNNISLSGFSFGNKEFTDISGLYLDKAYFLDESQDGLSFLGDLCRAFCSVILRKDNYEYELINRRQLRNQTAIKINDEDIYSPFEEFDWTRYHQHINIESNNKRTGESNYYGYNDRSNNKKSTLTIQADIMAALETYYNNAYQYIYEEIKSFIYDQYLQYYDHRTRGLSCFVEGLSLRPGMLIEFADRRMLIEETIKDFSQRKTKILGHYR